MNDAHFKLFFYFKHSLENLDLIQRLKRKKIHFPCSLLSGLAVIWWSTKERIKSAEKLVEFMSSLKPAISQGNDELAQENKKVTTYPIKWLACIKSSNCWELDHQV